MKYILNITYLLRVVTIIALLAAASCCGAILWPPDMVPHPPHFPQPKPHPGDPIDGR